MGSDALYPSLCRPLRQQLYHSEQALGGSDEPSRQFRSDLPLKPCLPKPSDHLDPAPNFFDPFPNPLTGLVARMTRRPAINRRAHSSLPFLSYVWGIFLPRNMETKRFVSYRLSAPKLRGRTLLRVLFTSLRRWYGMKD